MDRNHDRLLENNLSFVKWCVIIYSYTLWSIDTLRTYITILVRLQLLTLFFMEET